MDFQNFYKDKNQFMQQWYSANKTLAPLVALNSKLLAFFFRFPYFAFVSHLSLFFKNKIT